MPWTILRSDEPQPSLRDWTSRTRYPALKNRANIGLSLRDDMARVVAVAWGPGVDSSWFPRKCRNSRRRPGGRRCKGFAATKDLTRRCEFLTLVPRCQAQKLKKSGTSHKNSKAERHKVWSKTSPLCLRDLAPL